jgi:hypothetical protein
MLRLLTGLADVGDGATLHVLQSLNDAARPDDFHLVGGGGSAETKTHDRLTGRGVTDAGGGVIVEISAARQRDMDLRTQAVAITFGSAQAESEPIVVSGCDVSC